MSTSKNIQDNLMEAGTLVNKKTIQCLLSLEFSLKSCKPSRKPHLTQCLDFAKRHVSWNVDIVIETFSVYKNTLIL